MITTAAAYPIGSLEGWVSSDRATPTLVMTTRVDTSTRGKLWRDALHVLEQSRPIQVGIDASGVSYGDEAGVGFIV